MDREQILDLVKSLSRSQGFYGRLYEQIHDNDEALEYLEQQNFKDDLDLILFLEQ